MLQNEGIAVNLLVVVDGAFSVYSQPLPISSNVEVGINFYQTERSDLLSRGYPAEREEGNTETLLFNKDETNKTSKTGGEAHGSMDEDTQSRAERVIKLEMTGDLYSLIKILLDQADE